MSLKVKMLEVIRSSAFNKNLGLQTIQTVNGEAIVTAVVLEKNLNPMGKLQGGVVYSLCDLTAYAAFLSAAPDGTHGVSNHLSIQMLRTADLGDIVTYTGKVKKIGKRQCFLYIEVFSKEKLIATASITKTLIEGFRQKELTS